MLVFKKMYKILAAFLLFLGVHGLSSPSRRKRENTSKATTTNWRSQFDNCSNMPIHVRLLNLSTYNASGKSDVIPATSKSSGLLGVLHPNSSGPLFVCLREDESHVRQIYLLSHIACRQLRFMTFTYITGTMPEALSRKPYHSLEPNSWSCNGQEQSLTHCSWINVSTGSCPMLTKIACGACRETIKDNSGIVKSPGFPLVYFFDVTCQLHLIVPDKHSILLSFNRFDTMESGISSHVCEHQKPYVEILYGNQEELSIYRYCNFQDIKSLSIPFHQVKIRIFSGFYLPGKFHGQNNNQAWVFSFQALPIEDEHSSQWKIIFFIVLFCIGVPAVILSHYCRKHGACDYKQQLAIVSGHHAPAMDNLNATYQHQQINSQENITSQSLRMRSGGRDTIPENQYFPNSAETNYEKPRDFRKQLTQSETPRTVIPSKFLNVEDGFRAKIALLDKYPKISDCSTNKLSVGSSVFCPVGPSFQIYKSRSSERSEEEKEEQDKTEIQL